MSEDTTVEYTTDRGVALHVLSGPDGRRRAVLIGDDGQRIEFAFADVPRVIQTLEWAMRDARNAEDERQTATAQRT